MGGGGTWAGRPTEGLRELVLEYSRLLSSMKDDEFLLCTDGLLPRLRVCSINTGATVWAINFRGVVLKELSSNV